MKSFLALTLILGSQLVQAAPMDDQIRSLARRVTNNSQMAERLTQDEKIQVLKALNNADVILARVGTDYGNNGPGPGPGRDPWPSQPGPSYPPYPPYPSTVSCEREPTSVFQAAFVKVKNFAYSGNGLNYDGVSATNFAQEWARKYPCAYADQYVKNGTRIRTFAYSGNGLNYTGTDATAFTVANIDKFCSNYNLEQEFSAAYTFAYSGTGLNMNGTDARNYALNRVQSNAFTCRNY
ncbi:hypothetical protein SHI21_05470 [Bacteriovorax sp. PP10]|uniref:Uncharacterized protein n=1 Tax=Bacteriovorax antarcticus TaxID=3088717 RepID=A0ABU5VVI2_9BACT|nr:hypothetical protein [Bacteriovorax sp. PP10]MEA9355635.1 hypothetical protein [Bacteriovorax sp. PP10]